MATRASKDMQADTGKWNYQLTAEFIFPADVSVGAITVSKNVQL